MAIYDGYLSPPATQERIANVVEMLEAEVFGEKTVKGASADVTVEVGVPINLLSHYADYKKKTKRPTFWKKVTTRVERTDSSHARHS